MRKILLILVIGGLGCLHSAIAQPLLKQAVLVDNRGDSLRGWVVYKGWERSPVSIAFSPDSSTSHLAEYTVAQLAYVEIEGAEIYERGQVCRYVPFASLDPLSTRPGDSLLCKAVWMRLLLKGPRLSLYRYAAEKTNYYGREGQGEFDLLPERGFHGLLNLYAQHAGREDLLPYILRTAYLEKDLVQLFDQLNGGRNSQAYTQPILPNPLRFFVGLGAAFSSVDVSGDVRYLGNLDFGSAVGPHVRLGMDYVFASGLSPWAMRLELSYSSLRYKATGTSVTSSLNKLSYDLQQHNIAPVFSALYHVLNRRQTKVYLGMGVAYNNSFYPKNTMTHSFPNTLILEDYMQLAGGWFSANAKLGVIVHRRWEAGAEYIFGNYSQEMRYSLNPHTGLIWLGYRLN